MQLEQESAHSVDDNDAGLHIYPCQAIAVETALEPSNPKVCKAVHACERLLASMLLSNVVL